MVDVDYNDIYCAGEEEKKERYLLDYLGSVQCAHKGSDIIVQVMMSLKTHSVLLFSSWFLHHCDTEFLLQAVTKMTSRVENGQKTTCILEISDKGIKMVDKSKPGVIIQTLQYSSIQIFCVSRTEMAVCPVMSTSSGKHSLNKNFFICFSRKLFNVLQLPISDE